MPVAVSLDFILPAEEGIVTLRVWESPTSTGVFTQIDETSEVGTYPNYITHYTTAQATAVDRWFALQWVDSKGAESSLSSPWKGGTQSLVDTIADRVRQRDTSLPMPVIIQEAEAAIESFFGESPYTASIEDQPEVRRYQILNGLTYLVLARSVINEWVKSSDVASVTIGMVTMRQGGSTDTAVKKADNLLSQANTLLGISTSIVMLMEDVRIGRGSLSSFDQSRLIGWVGLA